MELTNGSINQIGPKLSTSEKNNVYFELLIVRTQNMLTVVDPTFDSVINSLIVYFE